MELNSLNHKVQDTLIPEWLNETNFKKLLLKTHPKIEELTKFEVYPAMEFVDNYITLLLRVKVIAKCQDDVSQEFSYIIKLPHESQEFTEISQALNLFNVENAVYNKVIPELEDIYHQVGTEVKFGATSYSLDLEDKTIQYVLMEDLSVEGFKHINHLESLDMDHTLSVLRKMAQFHAASACRVAKKGDYPEIFSPDMDNEMARKVLNEMFMAFKKPFLNNLKTYENGEKYMDLMENFFDNFIELSIRIRKLLPQFFCVLNQGDLWCNNILFKYAEDGKLEETRLVDFQTTNWGSPASDLFYFIISSVDIDIKLSKFDYFISYYYEHLSQNLKLLEYPLDIPDLEDLNKQLNDFGFMATMTSFFTLGFALLDPSARATYENFLGDSEISEKLKNDMYSNKSYRKCINEILPWLYDRGFMEVNLSDLGKRIAEVDDELKEEVV